jgi:hypothetical protein
VLIVSLCTGNYFSEYELVYILYSGNYLYNSGCECHLDSRGKKIKVMDLQFCANGVLCTGNYLYHSGFGQESLCMDLACRKMKLSLGFF